MSPNARSKRSPHHTRNARVALICGIGFFGMVGAAYASVPVGDPRFSNVRALADIPGHWLREIENFFQTYKRLQDVETELEGWSDRDTAIHMIEDAKQRYIELQV